MRASVYRTSSDDEEKKITWSHTNRIYYVSCAVRRLAMVRTFRHSSFISGRIRSHISVCVCVRSVHLPSYELRMVYPWKTDVFSWHKSFSEAHAHTWKLCYFPALQMNAVFFFSNGFMHILNRLDCIASNTNTNPNIPQRYQIVIKWYSSHYTDRLLSIPLFCFSCIYKINMQNMMEIVIFMGNV